MCELLFSLYWGLVTSMPELVAISVVKQNSVEKREIQSHISWNQIWLYVVTYFGEKWKRCFDEIFSKRVRFTWCGSGIICANEKWGIHSVVWRSSVKSDHAKKKFREINSLDSKNVDLTEKCWFFRINHDRVL